MSDTYAGGLAGSMQNGRIVNSAAATMIAADKANAYAGGLVGYSQGNLTITDAYSDCYLSSDNAAGLIGCLDGKADISNSYAVGYINSPSGTTACAAGFCLGTGNVHADASYSAMLFTKNAKNYPLAKSKSSTYAHTYYLNSDYFSTADAEAVASLGRSYETLTDTEQWETLFGADNHFEVKNTSDTHAYNLQTTLSLTSYNYPGLKEKDHYGDWGAQFQNGSLVYFETYQDGKTAYGFNGGSLNLLLDEYAVEDGYAIAFRSTDVIAQHGMTIEVTYYNNEGKKREEDTELWRQLGPCNVSIVIYG
jgi:hypothetical protein